MIYTEIEADGDAYIPPFGIADTGRLVTVRPETTIMIEANVDGATVTVGYEDVAGAFQAYPDGDITATGGAVFNHGIGARLMINVSGITANSVFIAQSSS